MPKNRRRRRPPEPQNGTAPKTAVKQKVLDEIHRGGKIVLKSEAGGSMSDDELRIAIKSTEVALAYLEGRGRSFDLATSVLRRDLSMLEQYRDMRKASPKNRSAANG